MSALPMERGNSVDWKSVRRILVEERRLLFDRFQGDPSNVRLAMEVKQLDDRILECGKKVQHLEGEQAA